MSTDKLPRQCGEFVPLNHALPAVQMDASQWPRESGARTAGQFVSANHALPGVQVKTEAPDEVFQELSLMLDEESQSEIIEHSTKEIMSDVALILTAIEKGEPQAASKLLPLVYDELRQLAAQKLAQEQPGQTLQATALVHEAYFRLVGNGDEPHWDGRGHFFAAAAEAMRRILVERARRNRSEKHGGGKKRHDVDEVQLPTAEPSENLLALDAALTRMEQTDPTSAKLVQLRYFAGLTWDETAQALGIPRRSAERMWAHARAWLHREIQEKDEKHPVS